MSGYWLLSVDQGQIEARVIAMASLDRNFVNQLWDNFDIHQHWAERFAQVYPLSLSACEGNIKKLRDKIKNKWVFPCFFGSTPENAMHHMEINDYQIIKSLYDEFWEMYPGVRSWQETVRQQYQDKGYVQALSGRRRHAPLSQNELINSGIQGAASDITVDAQNRLSELAQETKQWRYQSRINIHDDLGFVLPDSTIEQDIALIAEYCTNCSYEWTKCVPLSAEIKIGRDWYHQDTIGTFFTRRELLKYPF